LVEETAVELLEVVQEKYLNYALSVITDRALPDVRDGLKPVQRRILYAMFHDLHLYPDSKHKKCASIVGEVLGKYHPHGDVAAYEAMVRLSQDFIMRYPLVEGSGNFGSVDGDGAAAYRYTEARLTPLGEEMLVELRYHTVDYRPNFDGQMEEPLVLPCRWPQLLSNGTSGIAVGMATSIPPHCLAEVIDACLHLIEDRELTIKDLMKDIQGPDFPTGAVIINTKKELEEIYTNGSGSVIQRAEHKVEPGSRGKAQIVVTAIPYQVNRAQLVEQIGGLIQEKKVPQLLDVVNESDSKTRIVLELKSKGDADLVLNYLYKNTPLQNNFKINLTLLVPTEVPGVNQPIKANLKEFLENFIEHRFVVLKRRFEYELEQLKKRIHILKGFELIFFDLDKALKIIRRSEGREACTVNLMKAFPLDRIQSDAILETRLYNLSKLEVEKIKEELKEKKNLAKELGAKLASKRRMWTEVKNGLKEIREKYGDKRRTRIATRMDSTIELDVDAYIQHEEMDVVLTREGWIKRMKEVKQVSTLRVREGDSILAVIRENTKNNLLLFTNKGVLYSLRVYDLQYTTGYGEPIQKKLNFSDGEKIIAITPTSKPRGESGRELKIPFIFEKGENRDLFPVIFVTARGMGFRYLISREEQTSRKGKRCVKLGQDDEVIACYFQTEERLFMATHLGRGSEIGLDEVNTLTSAAKGMKLIKLDKGDHVVAAALTNGRDMISLMNSNNNEVRLRTSQVKLKSRIHSPKKNHSTR